MYIKYFTEKVNIKKGSTKEDEILRLTVFFSS